MKNAVGAKPLPIACGGKFFNFRNVAALTDGMMQVARRKDKER